MLLKTVKAAALFLVVFGLWLALLVMTSGCGEPRRPAPEEDSDFLDPSNPLSPLSPANPANPASPFFLK